LIEDFDVNFLTDELVSAFFIEEDSKTFAKAMRSIDASFWKAAIKNEFDSIRSNQILKLVDLPKDSRPISSKWIFKKKLRPNGSIDNYKARLVIIEFDQKKAIDNFDTYSPVTKIATTSTQVTLAAIYSLVVHQMDTKIAFLNGDLEEEIYMS